MLNYYKIMQTQGVMAFLRSITIFGCGEHIYLYEYTFYF